MIEKAALLKFILTGTISATNSCDDGNSYQSLTQTSSIVENHFLKYDERDISKAIIEKTLVSFIHYLDKKPFLLEGYNEKAIQSFSKVLDKIDKILPSNVIFAITYDKSLYFRIYKNNVHAHLEVYFDTFKDDKVDSICSVYSDDKRIANITGDLDKKFPIISEYLTKNMRVCSSFNETDNKYSTSNLVFDC